jgi:hypothetical protein
MNTTWEIVEDEPDCYVSISGEARRLLASEQRMRRVDEACVETKLASIAGGILTLKQIGASA